MRESLEHHEVTGPDRKSVWRVSHAWDEEGTPERMQEPSPLVNPCECKIETPSSGRCPHNLLGCTAQHQAVDMMYRTIGTAARITEGADLTSIGVQSKERGKVWWLRN